MLLQTLNRLEPIMVHLAKVQGLHPVELFKECMGAIGELATLIPKSPPARTARVFARQFTSGL